MDKSLPEIKNQVYSHINNIREKDIGRLKRSFNIMVVIYIFFVSFYLLFHGIFDVYPIYIEDNKMVYVNFFVKGTIMILFPYILLDIINLFTESFNFKLLHFIRWVFQLEGLYNFDKLNITKIH